MTAEEKEWLDAADIGALIQRWREAPIGDPWFADIDRASYHQLRMDVLRREDPAAYITVSKRIGWRS